MNFVQIEFLWFMLVVLSLYWTARSRAVQNAILLVASAIFYGWVHPWFLALLAASALLDYTVALLMVRAPRWRDLLLVVSLCGNLGVLGYFKYFDFFVENVIALAGTLGITSDLRTLGILLPVGVSFYTFQTMSYALDVYRGDLEPRSNLVDYLLYVSFFPQLVAGPIERASSLLPQIEAPRRLHLDRVIEGASLAAWGGFKKVCLADTLAPYVDKVFVLADPSGPLIWAASIGFMIQIFADFSGYTDIARGAARMLGFELVENFRSPYLAASTPEFWQRWHISLSFWIRDYLLVPLLGVRQHLSVVRFVWATLVTFSLVGLWHGASWNFVLFGLFHGVWMTVYTLLGRRMPPAWKGWRAGRAVAIGFHLVAVSVPGSLLFRETHLDRIVQHLSKNPFAASDAEWTATAVVLGVVFATSAPLVAAHVVERHVLPWVRDTEAWLPLQTGAWAILGTAMFVFFRVSASDFIYFQF